MRVGFAGDEALECETSVSSPVQRVASPQRPHPLIPLALAFLLIFHGVANVCWLAVDNHPVVCDEHRHVAMAHSYYRVLLASNGPFESLLAVATLDSSYPPLLYLLSLPFMVLLDPAPDAIALTMTLSFMLLILGVYSLSCTFLEKRQAIFAAFVASFTPILYCGSRYYSQDYFCTTLVVWGVYALIRSRWGQSRRHMVLFGLLAGLGLLVKPTTCFFWCGPLAVMVAWGGARWASRLPRASARPWRVLMVNLVIAAGIALATSLPWYAVNLGFLLDFWTHTHGAKGTFGLPEGRIDLLAYAFLLVNLGMFLPLFCLSLAGAVLVFARKHYRVLPAVAVVAWVLGSYLLMTFLVRERELRYMLPAVPALGILAALPILAVPGRRFRLGAGLALSALLVLQYLGLNWGAFGVNVIAKPEDVKAIEFPRIAYRKKHGAIVYEGSDKLSVYRGMLISGAYNYGPPCRGDNYIDRCFGAMIAHANARPPSDKATVNFQSLAEDLGTSGLSQTILYAPEPNLLAVSQWRDQPLCRKPLVELGAAYKPEELLPALPDTDYVICKIWLGASKPRLKEEWTAFLTGRGFVIIEEFFDRGFGMLCPAGDFIILARGVRF